MSLWNFFVEAVDDYFDFLQNEYGLTRQAEGVPFVTFESGVGSS